MRIHILKHGSTLCGIPWCSIGDPSARWVSFEDRRAETDATCKHCLAATPAGVAKDRADGSDSLRVFERLLAKRGAR